MLPVRRMLTATIHLETQNYRGRRAPEGFTIIINYAKDYPKNHYYAKAYHMQ